MSQHSALLLWVPSVATWNFLRVVSDGKDYLLFREDKNQGEKGKVIGLGVSGGLSVIVGDIILVS